MKIYYTPKAQEDLMCIKERVIETWANEELAKKAEVSKGEIKLTKSMSIADLIKAMEPEIKKALPEVITPERFTRMALSALNTTPKLQECGHIEFPITKRGNIFVSSK